MSRVHQWFVQAVWLVAYFFTPHFWRFFLRRQVKVRVHLDTGAHVDVYCESWNVTIGGEKGPGCSHYSFKKMRKGARFNIERIVAVEER